MLLSFPIDKTLRFIPAPEISSTEGNKYVNTISNYNALFYFYVVIFSYC